MKKEGKKGNTISSYFYVLFLGSEPIEGSHRKADFWSK